MDLLNLDLSAPEWRLVWPQLIVFLLAVVLVFADAFIPKHRSFQILTGMSIVGYRAGDWARSTGSTTGSARPSRGASARMD